MANHKKDKIKTKDLQGFKYFKLLKGILSSLHDAGCERDRAGNRLLHMDEYVCLLLLYMFNPICTSLRSLQQASELKKVQKLLCANRASLGSLSESSGVFDSELLKKVVQELSQQLPDTSVIPGYNQKLYGKLTAVDGSIVQAVADMAWASWKEDRNGIKLHTQFEILTNVPIEIDVTDANGNEKKAIGNRLQSERMYVFDRGYAKYELLQDIININSSFVCRIRDNAKWQELEDKPLSDKAIEDKILFDKIATLGGETVKTKLENVRVIAVECTPKPRREHKGHSQSEKLLIVTDNLELDAETIAAIYKYRWTVEIFFRFYKHVLGCRHLISHNKNGIEMQCYAAIIACMLMSIWTGRKPTLRTYEMICWYFTGMADEEDLLNHIARLKKHD